MSFKIIPTKAKIQIIFLKIERGHGLVESIVSIGCVLYGMSQVWALAYPILSNIIVYLVL